MKLPHHSFSKFAGALALVLLLTNNVFAGHPPTSVLAAKWWQWALSAPESSNPVTDTTGEFAAVGQKGQIWFLAGNRDGGTTVRTITVPEGTALFFPIVNTFLVDEGTIEEERARNTATIDTAAGLTLEVDGTPIPVTESDREQSTLFAIKLPEGNIYGAPAATYAPAVDEGYYVLLEPLSPGTHTIHFSGSVAGFSLDVTYYVTVE
jgi:hypothetical protein